MTLHIRLTRAKKTRILSAYVVQRDAEREILGDNILAGRKLSRIPSAEAAVAEYFHHQVVLKFEHPCTPDVDPAYRAGEDRNAVRREVGS